MPEMIPIGYLYKTIVAKPEFMTSPSVQDVYSVSSHVSANFDNYCLDWKHNGYWLFDCPSIMQTLASRKAIDLSATTLSIIADTEEGPFRIIAVHTIG